MGVISIDKGSEIKGKVLEGDEVQFASLLKAHLQTVIVMIGFTRQ